MQLLHTICIDDDIGDLSVRERVFQRLDKLAEKNHHLIFARMLDINRLDGAALRISQCDFLLFSVDAIRALLHLSALNHLSIFRQRERTAFVHSPYLHGERAHRQHHRHIN